MKLLTASFGARDMPGALDVPGVTVESMRPFAKAARSFYEASRVNVCLARIVCYAPGSSP
ncbi:MAG: hypothetical protein ACRD21_10710 [Vicinamibacteria bacterium]